MNEPIGGEHPDLANKIARLVEEKGWNQEDFARVTGLNRQTVRQILLQTGDRRLRNATVSACARALGLTVHDLRSQPLERLLARMHQPTVVANGTDQVRRLYELASQPELRAWMERNTERSQQLTPDEIQEILALQGAGGPLTAFGVESFVLQLERRRQLIQQVTAIAGTEYLDLLEQLVGLIYEKVYPHGDGR